MENYIRGFYKVIGTFLLLIITFISISTLAKAQEVGVTPTVLPPSQLPTSVFRAPSAAVSSSPVRAVLGENGYHFTRTLTTGSVGEDVTRLQKWLNSNGYMVASIGAGSPGHETDRYGRATANAVIKFQEANASSILTPNGITQGTGRFANSTRAFLNSILERTHNSGQVLGATDPQSLFASWDTPAVANENDSAQVELGLKFRSSVPGAVIGMRFYKSSQNTGTHVGTLWKNGTKLAEGTFTGESGTGWQTLMFASPVQIDEDTNYVVSYNAPNGHYSTDYGYFSNPRSEGDLYAPQGAGVYKYGSKAYPNQVWNNSNYWVDVLFSSASASDPTPPSVTVTSPSNGQTISGDVTLTASASDNVGVEGVQFYLDGLVQKDEDTTAPYSVTWDTATDTNGTHTIYARARDAAGNFTNSSVITITVSNNGSGGSTGGTPDTSTPSVSFTAPASRATVSGTVTVSASASDNVGVEGVQFKVDGALIADDTTAPYAVEWDTTTVSNGNRTLTVIARDAAGNTRTRNRTVKVNNSTTPPPPNPDTTAPTVSCTAPSNNAIVSGINTTVSANASDNIAVASVQFKLGALFLGAADTTAPYSIGWDTTSVTDGQYTISCIATDTSGNTRSATTTVTVQNGTVTPPGDTTAPTVSLTAPSNGATLSGTTTLTASASDNVGVTKVEFYRGATLLGTDTSSPYSYSWNTTTTTNNTYSLTAKAYDAVGNTGTSTAVSVTVNNVQACTPTNGTYEQVYSTGYDTNADLDPFNHGQIGNGSLNTNSAYYVTGPGSFHSVPADVSSGIRSEVQYGSGQTPTEGAMEWDVYYKKVFSNNGHSFQFHPNTSGGSASPGLWHVGGKFVWNNWKNGTNTSHSTGVTIQANNWYHMRIEFKFGSNGYFRHYIDGTKVTDWTGQVGDGSGQYVKVGVNMWSQSGSNSDVYYDNFKVWKLASSTGGTTCPTGDTTAPTVSLTSPSNGATLSGTTTLTASASDNVGVTKVEFYRTFNGTTTLLGSDSSSPYSYSWNTAGLASGNYSLTAKAYDAANNTATSTAISVAVNNVALPDTTAPVVSLTAPSNNATISGVATVSATASDAGGSGLVGVTFKYGASAATATNLISVQDTTSPYSVQWNTVGVTNGVYVVTATAVDGAGNTATTTALTVTINNPIPDTIAPTVALTAPLAGTISGTVALTATALDNVGVTKVEFYRSGSTTPLGDDNSSPWQYSWDTTSVTNGSYSITAKAYDASGNSATSLPVIVSVDNTVVTPPPASGNLTAVVTYESIGLYMPRSSAMGSMTSAPVRYRQAGTTAWKNALPLWYDSRTNLGNPAQFRGSILNVSSGTSYEVQVTDTTGNTVYGSGTFTTWSDNKQIGQTITLPASTTSTITISQSGTPTGYILYQAASGGSTVSSSSGNCISVSGSYIIIRGLTIKNCKNNAIEFLSGAHDVIVEGNDISKAGVGSGTVQPEESGSITVGGNESALLTCMGYNYSSAQKPSRITIQGNKIHDPTYGSNPWGSGGHPIGPNAIGFFECGGNNVYRYNDIYSHMGHYFMDGIGGSDNFTATGYPNYDSDIYGNTISEVYDDGIEAEGGNRNVRIWGNYITGPYIGIAEGTVSVGPIYTYRNINSSHGASYDPAGGGNPDNESERGNFFKLGSQSSTYVGGKAYYFNNTALQPACPSGTGASQKCGIRAFMENSAGSVLAKNIESANNIYASYDGSTVLGYLMSNSSGTFANDLVGSGGTTVTISGKISGSPTFATNVDEGLTLKNVTAGSGGTRVTRAFVPSRTANDIGNFSLASNSPGRGAAKVIANVTDMYASPDVGAQQSGTTMKFGTALWNGARAWDNGSVVTPPPNPDTTAPTVSFSAPSNNATVTGSVTVTASASDNTAISSVAFKLDSASGTLLSTDSSSPYSFSWDTTAIANGAHTLYAIATDTSGNTAQATRSVTVSNTVVTPPPTTTVNAQGFGAQAVGGANSSTICHVTNLSTSGTGSLANCIGSNRTIVFDVAGTIVGRYDIANTSYLTIDGGTAPSPGIVINNNNNGDGISLNGSNTHHIILKDLTVRNAGNDCINTIDGAHDIVITNVATYDCRDGNIDIANDSNNVTIQYSVLGDNQGSGKTLVTSTNVSVHHNLYTTGSGSSTEGKERNPYVHANYSSIGSPNIDFRNNLIYNWGRYASGIGYKATGNFVNNYYASNKSGAIDPDADPTGNSSSNQGQYYVAGNTILGGANINLGGGNHAEYSIPSWAQISAQDACTAAYDVLTKAGPKYKDSTTQGYISAVTSPVSGCGTTGGGGTTGDTTAPTVSIASPVGASIISGTVTVSATATDNVGVAGVTFKYGTSSSAVNTTIGSEDTSSPFSVSWNTSSLTNGTYYLRATARDAAGNTTTSNAISVSVNNTTSGGGTGNPGNSGGTVGYIDPNSGTCANAVEYSGYTRTYCIGYDQLSEVQNSQLANGTVSTSVYRTGPGSFYSRPANVSSGTRSEVQYDGSAQNNTEGIVEYDVMYEVIIPNNGHSLQWHPETTGGSASPGLWHDSGKFVWNNWKGGINTPHATGVTIQTNKWYHMKIEYKFGSNGYFRHYIDGVKVTDWTGQVGDGSGQYLKVGYNGWDNNSSNSRIYYDNLRVYKKN